jgi:hypothetical protein
VARRLIWCFNVRSTTTRATPDERPFAVEEGT